MDIARHWRLRRQRYALEGDQCPHCREYIFPPRDICPHCGEEAGPLHAMSGKGEVYSFTVVHEPPTGYETQAPYAVALVKLEEGPLVTAQLTVTEKLLERRPHAPRTADYIARRKEIDYGVYARYRGKLKM